MHWELLRHLGKGPRVGGKGAIIREGFPEGVVLAFFENLFYLFEYQVQTYLEYFLRSSDFSFVVIYSPSLSLMVPFPSFVLGFILK